MTATVHPIEDARRPKAQGFGPPPHNLEAERVVVHAAARDLARAGTLRGLVAPDHFFDRDFAVVYQVVLELAGEGLTAEPMLICDRLRRANRRRNDGSTAWLAFVEDLVESSGLKLDSEFLVSDCEMFAEMVVDLWRAREARAACLQAIAELTAGTNVRASLEGLREDVDGLLCTTRQQSLSIASVAAEVWSELMEPRDPSPPRWPWKSCHAAFGPFVRGEVTYLAARPEAGKTNTAFQAASAIAESKADEAGWREAVMFFSLEMSRGSLFTRQTAIRARVHPRAIREGNMTQEQYDRMTAVQKEWATTPLIIEDFDGDDAPLERIEAAITNTRGSLARGGFRTYGGKRMARARLRLVMIDHLTQILSPAGRGASVPEQIAATTRGLKKLAKRTGVHLLVLAHAGTRAEDRGKDLSMRDVFGSSGPERDADTMIFLTRPHDDELKLVHAKSRMEVKAKEPVWLNYVDGVVWESACATSTGC